MTTLPEINPKYSRLTEQIAREYANAKCANCTNLRDREYELPNNFHKAAEIIEWLTTRYNITPKC